MLDTEEATVGVLKIPRIFERKRKKKKTGKRNRGYGFKRVGSHRSD